MSRSARAGRAHRSGAAHAGRASRRAPTSPHGETDGCLAAGLTQGVEAHLPPGSRAEIVPEAGHFLHLERPAVVGRAVAGWLA